MFHSLSKINLLFQPSGRGVAAKEPKREEKRGRKEEEEEEEEKKGRKEENNSEAARAAQHDLECVFQHVEGGAKIAKLHEEGRVAIVDHTSFALVAVCS